MAFADEVFAMVFVYKSQDKTQKNKILKLPYPAWGVGKFRMTPTWQLYIYTYLCVYKSRSLRLI